MSGSVHGRFMKITLLLIAVVVFAGVVHGYGRDDGRAHGRLATGDQGAGAPVLPPGAEAAVLFGDPSKEGLFALRLKLPQGYSVPPHTHPVDEVVTVISGTFGLGMGETADQAGPALARSGFFALPPETAHYVFIDEETVIQISTVGPWGLKYVNPEDDPRQKSR